MQITEAIESLIEQPHDFQLPLGAAAVLSRFRVHLSPTPGCSITCYCPAWPTSGTCPAEQRGRFGTPEEDIAPVILFLATTRRKVKSLQPAVMAQHQADCAEQCVILCVLANDYPRAQGGRDIAGLDERVAFI